MLCVVKNPLKFSRERNGLLLKLHHTVKTESGEKRRIRFIRVDITKSNEIFAAIEEDDNVFIFHLTEKCFWQLPEVKVHKCSAMRFRPHQSNNLLIGNESGFIYEIEITSGTIVRCTKAFSDPINQLLFPFSTSKMFVASSSNQIKIYDFVSFEKRASFTTKDDARIVTIKLIPNDDRMLVILHTSIICVLTSALKIIRHFDPVKARHKFVQRSPHKSERLNYISEALGKAAATANRDDDVDKLIKTVTRDYQNGLVMDVAVTLNGNSFCVCFADSSLMLCSTSMWDVRRVITFPDFYIKQCDFITSSGEYNPTSLLTATSNDELMLISLKDLNSKMLIEMNNSSAFAISPNGLLLLNVQRSGEVLVYSLDNCLNRSDDRSCLGANKGDKTSAESDVKCSKQSKGEWNVELDEIQMKLSKIMPIGRMLPILREFGEYPDKYRPMIWKTILKLPQNYNSFARLLKREPHSCVANYGTRYSLVDQRALNNLRKIVSCLAHWTPIFGYVTFLPKFVFPFLKPCKGDLVLCFELVATLLYNHCQLWFEFAPVQMPYNYLSLIENVLMENDPKLAEFYKSKDITAKIYALPLMETAFSEVLDETQWRQLWDHIISNEPYFLIFVIVAYNSALRLTIMRYEKVESIEQIFFEQNYVNFKKLMSKAYALMEKCPASIHPERYMKPFVPLARGEYQKFENYPKNVSDMKTNEIEALRHEQKLLDTKLAEMETFEKKINARMDSLLMDEEYAARMREVESTYAKALEEEEERITYQRKLLLLSIKKIRERENEMLIQAKNSKLSKRLASSEHELKSMQRSIEKQRTREEIELQMTEENLKLKEMSFQLKNFDIVSSGEQETLKKRHESTIAALESQRKKFMDQLQQLESSSSRKSPLEAHFFDEATKQAEDDGKEDDNVSPEVKAFERAFQKIQNDYARAVESGMSDEDYKRRLKALETESEQLEREIYQLLNSLKP